MSPTELLSNLRLLNIKIWADGGQLRVNAPKGVLTPNLQVQISQQKAELLDCLRRIEVGASPWTPPLQPRPRPGPVQLSFSQEGLWLHNELAPGSATYNVPTSFPIDGQLDIAALERSLGELACRHEALRTVFAVEHGEPVQLVSRPGRFHLPIVDLRRLTGEDPEAAAQRLIAEEANRPFDLTRGPLWRATLLQTGDERFRLLVTLHHIIADGWSLGIMVRELRAFYQAYATGQVPSLPALPVQYADFALWQRACMQGETLERHVSYWRRVLGGDLPILDLPADHPRPAEPSFRGAVECFELERTLWQDLAALSRREGATLYLTLFAAFNVLLHRYSGQSDIVIGTPVANRTRLELENVIGFFANTLALRTDLSGNPTIRELLGRVRDVMLGAHAHQELPFEIVVRTLRPRRDTGRSPLFQVMFAFENAMLSPLKVGTGASRYDLTFFLWEEADRLTGMVEYSTDLFEGATIRRLIEHFQILLQAVVRNPDCPIANLPLLAEAERQQLLVSWNETAAPVSDCCAHELIEAQAARTPDRVALRFEDQTLSYGELNRRANRLAHRLRTLGVGPDRLVGVCLERSPQMVIALLAVLKAGGGYVPLDPAYPRERLAFMIQDADLHVVLTQTSLRDVLPQHMATPVLVDREADVISRESADNLAPTATPSNLAYAIYTSGSTGTPKGVQIPHRAVVNFLASMQREPGLAEDDVLLAVTTLAFDIAVLELFLPLTVGATVVVASQTLAADGAGLSAALADTGATIMQATPVTWRLLLQAGWHPPAGFTALCGGEELPRELARQLLAWGTRLWNMYGPTETTVWSTIQRVDVTDGTISIGRPIANTSIFLLDDHLQPVPIGVPGELHIGGAGLARGYLNRPQLTAEKFIRHPFAADHGARLYKTGDIARYRADGTIELLGRRDHQIKLRGYRIELGEIEADLAEYPGVRQAVVVVREDTPGDQRLVAYLVATDPVVAPPAGDLRAFLKERLPAYMVPTAFVVLPELPLTPNGKIDRKGLLELTYQAPEEARLAPRTPVEQRLAEIYAQVLGIDQIGIEDNFFELGGHSLLAIQVVSRICEVFDLELPLRTLFESPTVADLAVAVVQESGTASDDEFRCLLLEVEGLSDEEAQAILLTEEK